MQKVLTFWSSAQAQPEWHAPSRHSALVFAALLVDKGCLCNSIFHYPSHMTFFTTPELLEIGDIPFPSPNSKPVRNEALEYYRKVAEHYAPRRAPLPAGRIHQPAATAILKFSPKTNSAGQKPTARKR